jgi:putative hydrolase of HD superfamily
LSEEQFSNQSENRLEQQFQFILEIDKLKQVLRRNYVLEGARRENDVEHSWHLAMMVIVLKEHSSSELDILKILKMVLVHDIVEIDAGDAFVYGRDNAAIHQVEQVAADRIFGLLPKNQELELRAAWDEFEAGESTEARFARALDRLNPILLNVAAEGRTWKEHGITANMVRQLNLPIIERASKELAEYAGRLFDKAEELGYFYEPT